MSDKILQAADIILYRSHFKDYYFIAKDLQT